MKHIAKLLFLFFIPILINSQVNNSIEDCGCAPSGPDVETEIIQKLQNSYEPKLYHSSIDQPLKSFNKKNINNNSLLVENNNLIDNKGKDFWVCFQQNYDNVAIQFKFFISSDENTDLTISIPGISYEKQFSIIANQITTINLPNPLDVVVSSSEIIENKGINITSEKEVTIYGLNQMTFSTDAYLALPLDILNTSYLVMSYPSLSSSLNASQFAIVSPYDNVQVSITPASDTEGGHLANQTFTVTLNKGDVYQVQANSGLDLTGSLIQSSLPIAVFSGHSCANVPLGNGYCDHLVEQLPPTSTWGTSFVTVPLEGRENGDTYRILSSNDNTEVKINGSIVVNLNFGDYYETILETSSQITSTNPVLVMQYSNGDTWDPNITNNGDPFMMLIPPTEQFKVDYLFSTPSEGFPNNYLSVSIPTSGISSLLLDGQSVNIDYFEVIGETGFSQAGIPVSVGSHRIENTFGVPFGIYSYGFWAYDSYGYPGGLSLEYIYEGSAPIISRTQETINLSNQAQLDGVAIPISVNVTDAEEPYIQTVSLFYRYVSESNFTEISMTNTSENIWSADIPSSAVLGPGIQYYIYASDGQLSSTNPSISPSTNAYNIAVLPNQLPNIDHTPVKHSQPEKDILITALVTDETYQVASVNLHYRIPGGNPIYTSIPMIDQGNNIYSAIIPKANVTIQGIDYYISATDDLGLSNFHGDFENPHQIIVQYYTIHNISYTLSVESTCLDTPFLAKKDQIQTGEYLQIENEKMPDFIKSWQVLFDALVGSKITIENGAIEENVELDIRLQQLSCEDPGTYLDPSLNHNPLFLFLGIKVTGENSGVTPLEDFYFFKNGKKGKIVIPHNQEFLNLLSDLNMQVDELEFAYYYTGDYLKDGITQEIILGSNGDVDSTCVYLDHFSQIAGGVFSEITDIENINLETPSKYSLNQNYPNPFNPTTNISYSIPTIGKVSLRMYDVLGMEVANLVDENKSAGNYSIEFNGADLVSGIYFYKLQVNDFVETKKLILMK